MISALLAAIDRGIALLREGQAQRRVFFVEVVEPVHRHIGLLQDLHQKAFDELSANLLDPAIPLPQAAKALTLAFERQDALCAQLYRLPQAALDEPRTEIRLEVHQYVQAIARALNFAPDDATSRTMIKFVDLGAIKDELSVGHLFHCRDESEPARRQRLFESVQSLRRGYNDAVTEITTSYIELRRKCHT